MIKHAQMYFSVEFLCWPNSFMLKRRINNMILLEITGTFFSMCLFENNTIIKFNTTMVILEKKMCTCLDIFFFL